MVEFCKPIKGSKNVKKKKKDIEEERAIGSGTAIKTLWLLSTIKIKNKKNLFLNPRWFITL